MTLFFPPKQLSLTLILWLSEVQLLWKNKRCHTHSLLYVRRSMAEASGHEDPWIQKANNKATVKPHPSPGAFPTFIYRRTQSHWEWWMDKQMEDWTKSLWCLHSRTIPPLHLHSISSCSPPTLYHPSCPTTFTQVHRSLLASRGTYRFPDVPCSFIETWLKGWGCTVVRSERRDVWPWRPWMH